jgi:hypothetical protein
VKNEFEMSATCYSQQQGIDQAKSWKQASKRYKAVNQIE